MVSIHANHKQTLLFHTKGEVHVITTIFIQNINNHSIFICNIPIIILQVIDKIIQQVRTYQPKTTFSLNKCISYHSCLLSLFQGIDIHALFLD